MIDLILVGVTLLIYLSYAISTGQKHKLEKELVKVLKDLSFFLEKGDPLPTAMGKIVEQGEAAGKVFGKVLVQVNKGISLQESLVTVAKKTGSKMFSYIADVLVIGLQSEQLPVTLRNLAVKLEKVGDLQEGVDEKKESAVFTMKLFGVLLLPSIFYFMAAINNAPITTMILVYLGVVTFMMSILDYALQGDAIGSLVFMPLAGSLFYMVVVRIGPLIMTNFGGLLAGLA